MSAVSLATLRDLSALGPDVVASLSILVRREQGDDLPLFISEGESPSYGDWPHVLRGQPIASSLARTMSMVEDLSDHEGHGLLRLSLRDEGVDFPQRACRHAVAVWAAAHHAALFERVHASKKVRGKVRMRTLRGRSEGTPTSDHPLARKRLEVRLAKVFDGSGRSSLCRVLASEEADGLHFIVDHGSNLRHLQTVEESHGAVGERCVRLRPRRRDHLHYSPRTGTLSVGAWDVVTLRAYGAAFGELLFGDDAWFKLSPLVTLDPLREQGRMSLRPTADVIEAKLTALKMRAPGPDGSLVTVESGDVLSSLEREGGQGLLDNGELVSAKIAVRVAGVPRRRAIDLKPPYQIAYDWDRGGEAVRCFLERRGFLACGAT